MQHLLASEGEEDTKANKSRALTKRRAHNDTSAGTRPRRGGKSAEKADDQDYLVLLPALKNAVLQVLAQALKRLMAIANQVKEADESDDDTDANVPDGFTRAQAQLRMVGVVFDLDDRSGSGSGVPLIRLWSIASPPRNSRQ